ncbi:MAG TPA: copper chaperone PCu(A)C [Rhizomicrobium sp.]
MALVVCGAASAAKVTVSGAWMRALPAHLPAAGYFTAHNGGKNDVDITGAQSLACGMLMLHLSSNDKGIGSMVDVPKVTVPAGGEVKFAPGGYHLMCMNPKPSVRPGKTIPVALQFSDGTSLVVRFAVRNARGR